MTGRTYIVGVLQVEAYRVLRRRVAAEVKRYGLNPTQWFILGQINERTRVRAADLADSLQVQAPLITHLTDDLDRRGLIEKVPDTKDRRVNWLRLSPGAQTQVPKIEAGLQQGLNELLAGLSDKDLQTYERVLRTIVKNSSS